MSPFKVKGCFRRVTFLPFGDEVLAYFSGSAECVVVVHRESFSLPSRAPSSPPSLSPSCPASPTLGIMQPSAGRKEWWENCVRVCDGEVDGWRKKEGLECIWEQNRDRQGREFVYSVFLLHSSFPSTLTRPTFLHSSSIKVVDKDGLATFAGLWLAVTAEQCFKGTAAIFATAKHQL